VKDKDEEKRSVSGSSMSDLHLFTFIMKKRIDKTQLKMKCICKCFFY